MIDIFQNLIERAYAVQTGVGIPGSGNTFANYNAYICAVYKYSLVIGAALSVLMIIFAGYKYMTSSGNQTAIADAKDIIIGTLIGFALLLTIRLVLNILGMPYCDTPTQ